MSSTETSPCCAQSSALEIPPLFMERFGVPSASYHLLENPIRRFGRLAADGVATFLMLYVCVAASWTAALIIARFTDLG